MNHSDKSSPIFDGIAAEHARMPELLSELHTLIASRAELPSTVGKAIDTLVVFLREHFRHEDEDGFFDEITIRAPRLLTRAREVSREHLGILAGMEAFRDVALMGDGSESWWDLLDREYHRLMKDLMHHEHQERELLQDTYTDDVGTGD